MDKRKTILALFLLFFTFTAAAQTSFNELVGSELTVEESLVNFVNTITAFEIESAAEVLLYLVAPLFGFYYLTLNFMSMSYELFEDRIDRDSWDRNDEDIPSGMKGFALISSFITVLFLGTLGAGLLLFTGLTSFLLAVLIMSGLFNEGIGGNENNGGQQTQQSQQGQQTQQPAQQGQQSNNGASLADILSQGANFLGQANNLSQNLQQQGQQRRLNQIQDSLGEFGSNMLEDINYVKSNSTSINRMVSEAESQLIDPSQLGPDDFKNISQRASRVNRFVANARVEMESDLSSSGNPSFSGSGLESHLSGSSLNVLDQLESLDGQIERIVSDKKVSPPDDVLNNLLDVLKPVVGVGHFVAESPYTMRELANDIEKCEEVVQVAESMNCLSGSSGSEASDLKDLAGWLDMRQQIVTDLISKSEKLCRKEMQMSKSEVSRLKDIIGKDQEMYKNLEFIASNFSKYQGFSSPPDVISDSLNVINRVDSKLASIESTVAQHGEFESKVYKKLKELESKI